MSVAAPIQLRVRGAIADLSPSDRARLLDRSTTSDDAIRTATAAIVDDVRRRGDAALRELAERFDHVSLESLEVPVPQRRRALADLAPALRESLERAASNIASVHGAARPTPITATPEPGITIVRRPDPLARVGVYAPGGRATYPSSVLMGAVPARVAGVGEIVLCSPPDASGSPSSLLLAASEIAKVDRVFAVGGAGAIAAMAFGTTSVPRVDRIVGPGNAYVAEAKLQVSGYVSIDSPAGPSELCVIADASTEPRAVALELLAQAEHDPSACVIAIVVGDAIASAIANALAEELTAQPRRDIISAALASNGALVTADSLADAVAFANEYAAEHLALLVARPDDALPQLRCAGTIFVGESSSVSFGDYMTGANHVLPTGGLARSYSGLSTLDFVRWTTIQRVTPAAAASLADDVARFADAEGLPGHATAARRAGSTSTLATR